MGREIDMTSTYAEGRLRSLLFTGRLLELGSSYPSFCLVVRARRLQTQKQLRLKL